MKRVYYSLSFAFLLFLPLTNAYAYKTEVHAILTDAAANRSVLSNNMTWQRMGFSGVPGVLPVTRYKPESKKIWPLDDTNNFVLDDGSFDYAKLMAFGADIEDTGIEHVQANGAEVYLYPFKISRALNHFYNPQNGDKLTVPLPNHSSPDWILETISIPQQRFSFRDAKAHYYRVFSGATIGERTNAIAQTIQTLGHVVHHIQDMGQPQHTRLDSHCDAGFCEGLDDLTYDGNDTSVYEIYTENIIRCGETGSYGYGATGAYRMPSAGPSVNCAKENLDDWSADWVAKTIQLNSYPIIEASNLLRSTAREVTARDFWTNEDRTGLADFSSRNFVSTDTAFRLQTCRFSPDCDPDNIVARLRSNSTELLSPSGQESDVTYALDNTTRLRDVIDLPSQIPSDYGNGILNFISSSFTDRYTGQVVNNNRLVSYSVFNERFTKLSIDTQSDPLLPPEVRQAKSIFTTNYFNMDEHARLLMPRAVAYSAGFINYFFRYNLSATATAFQQDPGNSTAPLIGTVNIANSSNYDLNTSHHDIFIENNNGQMELLQNGLSVSIPKNSSREFSINWPSYDYTGKVSIVFHKPINSSGTGFVKHAEAGLVFDVQLPDPPDQGPSCGAPFWTTGDTGNHTFNVDLTGYSGPVNVEIHSCPTARRNYVKATVNGLGDVIETSPSSGVVGNRNWSFDYDPSSHGSILQVELNSTGDTFSGWDFGVSCASTGPAIPTFDVSLMAGCSVSAGTSCSAELDLFSHGGVTAYNTLFAQNNVELLQGTHRVEVDYAFYGNNPLSPSYVSSITGPRNSISFNSGAHSSTGEGLYEFTINSSGRFINKRYYQVTGQSGVWIDL